jgi:hypothetical protein
MHNSCSSILQIIHTENQSQTILFMFNTKYPFRKMGQIWLCLGATTQDWSKTLKFGIKFLLKFAAIIYLGQNACMAWNRRITSSDKNVLFLDLQNRFSDCRISGGWLPYLTWFWLFSSNRINFRFIGTMKYDRRWYKPLCCGCIL